MTIIVIGSRLPVPGAHLEGLEIDEFGVKLKVRSEIRGRIDAEGVGNWGMQSLLVICPFRQKVFNDLRV